MTDQITLTQNQLNTKIKAFRDLLIKAGLCAIDGSGATIAEEGYQLLVMLAHGKIDLQ